MTPLQNGKEPAVHKNIITKIWQNKKKQVILQAE